tara:strand:+ start:294 stop:467 length:174 start_codon:yes stop_codon:yes gene_type:complete
MDITKKRLKEIIAEEMIILSESGNLEAVSESEKKAFALILEKLSQTELANFGIRRIK